MGSCSCKLTDIKKANINPKLHHKPLQDEPLSQKLTETKVNDSAKVSSKKLPIIRESSLLIIRSINNINLEGRTFINIVVLGSQNVGKSTFVIKYIENYFEKLYIPTIGKEINSKHVIFNDHPYKINFTVTSGNDYKIDYTSIYTKTDFFLVLFDLTSKETYEEAKNILKNEVMSYLYKYKGTFSNVMLIGNKLDKNERSVDVEKINQFVQKNELDYYEISVKTGLHMFKILTGIMKIFDELAFPEE